MIESRYWKDDLLRIAKQLKPVASPERWTEKLQVMTEKDIIIAFFIIRKLRESYKISDKTYSRKFEIRRCKNIKKVTNRNYWDIWACYDLKFPENIERGMNFICNQLIHGGATYLSRDNDRNWDIIYVCSDFERHNYIYGILIKDIICILEIIGNEYPNKASFIYSKEKGDYMVKIY